jgi:hypothetical protein
MTKITIGIPIALYMRQIAFLSTFLR